MEDVQMEYSLMDIKKMLSENTESIGIDLDCWFLQKEMRSLLFFQLLCSSPCNFHRFLQDEYLKRFFGMKEPQEKADWFQGPVEIESLHVHFVFFCDAGFLWC